MASATYVIGFIFSFLGYIFYMNGAYVLSLPCIIVGIILLCASFGKKSEKDEYSESRYDVQYEDIQRIDEYNNPNHRFYKAIREAIDTAAFNLDSDPEMDIDSQMRSLGIESYANYCPYCQEQLYLFKDFLVYCLNCKLFISELKYQ